MCLCHQALLIWYWLKGDILWLGSRGVRVYHFSYLTRTCSWFANPYPYPTCAENCYLTRGYTGTQSLPVRLPLLGIIERNHAGFSMWYGACMHVGAERDRTCQDFCDPIGNLPVWPAVDWPVNQQLLSTSHTACPVRPTPVPPHLLPTPCNPPPLGLKGVSRVRSGIPVGTGRPAHLY